MRYIFSKANNNNRNHAQALSQGRIHLLYTPIPANVYSLIYHEEPDCTLLEHLARSVVRYERIIAPRVVLLIPIFPKGLKILKLMKHFCMSWIIGQLR